MTLIFLYPSIHGNLQQKYLKYRQRELRSKMQILHNDDSPIHYDQ